MRAAIVHTCITIISMLFGLHAFAGTGNASKSSAVKTPDCLEICAKTMFDGERQTGVTVRLYCGNNEVVTIDSTEFEKVFLTLKRDQYYTVELSKPGFTTRRVGISTAVPKSVLLKPIFRFEFEVEMMKEMKVQDDFFLDFPVALVSFNARNECFEHSKKYTSKIKKEMSRAKPAEPMAISE